MPEPSDMSSVGAITRLNQLQTDMLPEEKPRCACTSFARAQMPVLLRFTGNDFF